MSKRFKIKTCPHCSKRYRDGFDGISQGCDKCLNVKRDEHGLAVSFLNLSLLNDLLPRGIKAYLYRENMETATVRFILEYDDIDEAKREISLALVRAGITTASDFKEVTEE